MTVRGARALWIAVLALVSAPPHAARAQETVHGADSLFVAPTVKIAWAVQKAASEDATTVVIRVVNSAGSYRTVRLDGVDPFSKSRKVLIPVRSIAEYADLTVPRTGFAEHPRCEIHLYRSEPASADQTASLTVYYLGVPDTTPEFRTKEAMDAYLGKMVGATK